MQLEEHLFGDDRPVPKDVYARLKSLEERVLYLEGVSPEYFLTAQIAMAKMSKQREEESDAKMRATQNDDEVMTSLTNINKRIQELRSSLLVDKKSGIKMEQWLWRDFEVSDDFFCELLRRQFYSSDPTFSANVAAALKWSLID